jgi:hypothetical protein
MNFPPQHFYNFFFVCIENDFLTIVDDSGEKTLKKSQLIWMLKNEKLRVSPDIKRRYLNNETKQLNIVIDEQGFGLWTSNIISKGDYLVIAAGRNLLYYGRVIEFRFYSKDWKKYNVMHCRQIDSCTKGNVTVVFDPAYKVRKEAKNSFDMLQNSLKISRYVCHTNFDVNFDDPEVKTVLWDLLDKFVCTHMH